MTNKEIAQKLFIGKKDHWYPSVNYQCMAFSVFFSDYQSGKKMFQKVFLRTITEIFVGRNKIRS